jgi:cellulose synthase/poly-beta-1,6-N-acetylglucosamine synthase-like glycosyltransferase
VDVFVPCYNEEAEIVEMTVCAALNLDYPNVRTLNLSYYRSRPTSNLKFVKKYVNTFFQWTFIIYAYEKLFKCTPGGGGLIDQSTRSEGRFADGARTRMVTDQVREVTRSLCQSSRFLQPAGSAAGGRLGADVGARRGRRK